MDIKLCSEGHGRPVHVCEPSNVPYHVQRVCDGSLMWRAGFCSGTVGIDELCGACVSAYPEMFTIVRDQDDALAVVA